MTVKSFHMKKGFNMSLEDRIVELEKLVERLASENKILRQELSEKNNYIMMLDRNDYESKG